MNSQRTDSVESLPASSSKGSLFRIAFWGGVLGAAITLTFIVVMYMALGTPPQEIVSDLWMSLVCGVLAFVAGSFALVGRINEFFD